MKNICAIVVTFNRRDLLQECLTHLQNQTSKLDKIIVIDNASTDGTPIIVKEYFSQVELIELPENVGGAGGFYEGIKYAHETGYEWLWVLDDDTIPEENALEMIRDTYNAFPSGNKPEVLASKVVWTDGTLHPMNYSNIKSFDYEKTLLAATNSCLNMRANSFVSVFIHSDMVTKYGLPYKEYFIWNDDVEYTSRILKEEFGVLCPKSIVVHKTKSKYTPVESAGDRYYYEVRNKLWLLKTNSLFLKEKIRILLALMTGVLKYLKINKFRLKSLGLVIRGFSAGILK